MVTRRRFLSLAAIMPAVAIVPRAAQAQQFLGYYIARLSQQDHHASDGYRLDNAAQVIRQDRANVHRFGRIDPQDESDPWFGSNNARAQLQSMLERPGALSAGTRRAIMNGTPLVRVDVYSNSVEAYVVD